MTEPSLCCRVLLWALVWAFLICGAHAQVSIRSNNPGAMWPGPVATRFGADVHIDLPDGNKIAVFPNATAGAAAQFALLKRSYLGLSFGAAIARWSGNNSPADYARTVAAAAGLDVGAIVTEELLGSDRGIVLAKAMARWEAGRPFPLTDDQWLEAQARGLGKAFVEVSPVDQDQWPARACRPLYGVLEPLWPRP